MPPGRPSGREVPFTPGKRRGPGRPPKDAQRAVPALAFADEDLSMAALARRTRARWTPEKRKRRAKSAPPVQNKAGDSEEGGSRETVRRAECPKRATRELDPDHTPSKPALEDMHTLAMDIWSKCVMLPQESLRTKGISGRFVASVVRRAYALKPGGPRRNAAAGVIWWDPDYHLLQAVTTLAGDIERGDIQHPYKKKYLADVLISMIAALLGPVGSGTSSPFAFVALRQVSLASRRLATGSFRQLLDLQRSVDAWQVTLDRKYAPRPNEPRKEKGDEPADVQMEEEDELADANKPVNARMGERDEPGSSDIVTRAIETCQHLTGWRDSKTDLSPGSSQGITVRRRSKSPLDKVRLAVRRYQKEQDAAANLRHDYLATLNRLLEGSKRLRSHIASMYSRNQRGEKISEDQVKSMLDALNSTNTVAEEDVEQAKFILQNLLKILDYSNDDENRRRLMEKIERIDKTRDRNDKDQNRIRKRLSHKQPPRYSDTAHILEHLREGNVNLALKALADANVSDAKVDENGVAARASQDEAEDGSGKEEGARGSKDEAEDGPGKEEGRATGSELEGPAAIGHLPPEDPGNRKLVARVRGDEQGVTSRGLRCSSGRKCRSRRKTGVPIWEDTNSRGTDKPGAWYCGPCWETDRADKEEKPEESVCLGSVTDSPGEKEQHVVVVQILIGQSKGAKLAALRLFECSTFRTTLTARIVVPVVRSGVDESLVTGLTSQLYRRMKNTDPLRDWIRRKVLVPDGKTVQLYSLSRANYLKRLHQLTKRPSISHRYPMLSERLRVAVEGTLLQLAEKNKKKELERALVNAFPGLPYAYETYWAPNLSGAGEGGVLRYLQSLDKLSMEAGLPPLGDDVKLAQVYQKEANEARLRKIARTSPGPGSSES